MAKITLKVKNKIPQNDNSGKSVLPYTKYIDIKTEAYKIVPYFNSLSMEGKYEFIENCIKYQVGSIEYKIFLNTLLIPNDIKFMDDYKNIKNINSLSSFYRVPPSFIIRKICEISEYKLDFLIKEGFIGHDLASQNYDWTQIKKDDLDEFVKIVSYHQPIIIAEYIDEIQYRGKIEDMLKRK